MSEPGTEDGAPITDIAYWDGVWTHVRPVKGIDPRACGPRNYVNRHLHQFFQDTFETFPPQGRQLVEVGCGASKWLPYFRTEFGFEITGIDYSEHGCKASRMLLEHLHVDGEIVQADIFDPPPEMLSKFDVLWTNGLVEHFTDTGAIIEACGALLKPGGLMITLVPNMTSLPGRLQRWFNRPLYEKHVPLDCGALAHAHRHAGLDVLSSTYVLVAHWGVLHLGALERKIGPLPAQALKIALGVPFWVIGPLIGMRPNRFTSPYLICVARRAR